MNGGVHALEVRQYLSHLQNIATNLALDEVDEIINLLVDTYDSGRAIYLFGNGGSAALASHFACDLSKGTAYCNGGKRLRVLALTDNVAMLTAWANDSSYEDVFSEQLRCFVQPRDVAFAISASGNSRNVLNALRVARDSGASTVGISGFKGGEMKPLCDICLVVPCEDMQIIEDLHLSITHAIYRAVYGRIAGRAIAATYQG